MRATTNPDTHKSLYKSNLATRIVIQAGEEVRPVDNSIAKATEGVAANNTMTKWLSDDLCILSRNVTKVVSKGMIAGS